MKIHYMPHSPNMIITHHLKQLWFPRYFCTPSCLDPHWPSGPLRSNHIIYWWKVIICRKVTMWWKVTINFQYKRHDEVSSSDVISSLIMTNHHDNVHSAFLDKLYYCRYICSAQVGVHSWPPTDCLPPLPWTQPSYWLDHTHHAFSFNLRRQQFLKRKSYYSKKFQYFW